MDGLVELYKADSELFKYLLDQKEVDYPTLKEWDSELADYLGNDENDDEEEEEPPIVQWYNGLITVELLLETVA